MKQVSLQQCPPRSTEPMPEPEGTRGEPLRVRRALVMSPLILVPLSGVPRTLCVSEHGVSEHGVSEHGVSEHGSALHQGLESLREEDSPAQVDAWYIVELSA